MANIGSILPFNWWLRMSPAKSFLLSWAVGVILVACSFLLGIAMFGADVELLKSGTVIQNLSLQLGYTQQLNYGPWYAIPLFCPTVFCLCSYLYKCSMQLPASASRFCDVKWLTERGVIIGLGVVLFFFFVLKNIVVEYRDYQQLALGWVQAESIQKEANLAVSRHSPIEIRRHFFTFTANNELIDADKVELVRATPAGFSVHGHRAFLAFIVVAKFWAGFWEGLVSYVSVLLAFWGFGVVCSIAEDQSVTGSDALAKLSIKWARPIIFASLILGIEGNLFSLSRFVANAAKGSFGTWDQYVSTITLAPPIVLGITSIIVAEKVLRINSTYLTDLATKAELFFWALWIATSGALLHLVLGFNDPFTNKLILTATKGLSKQ
jgi:hypothetical protein